MDGFDYRYRLGGGAPTVREFATGNGGVRAGDIVNFRDGSVDRAVTGDTELIGAARDVSTRDGGARTVTVVIDADAVYAVEDRHARLRGATLDLAESAGAQGVGPSVNAELLVVVDCGADEATLVRISIGKHHSLPPQPDVQRRTGGELNAAIARMIVRFHRERLGRGPTKAQAFYRGNVIVVILSDTLTKAERTLASAGRSDTVMEVRSAFQEAMHTELSGTVEELTGCRVVAFMSSNHLEPDLAAEIFILDRPVPGQEHL